MKIRTAVLACLVALVPMVARANPVTGSPMEAIAFWVFLAVAAEVGVELLILQWEEIWIAACLGLLVMHVFTVPLLAVFLNIMPYGVFLGEVAIIFMEGSIIYVAARRSAAFRRTFGRCLCASAAGNL